MKTTVYLIRHSKPLKVNNELSNDSLQLQNEKSILSIDGENIAKKKFENDEFKNIDVLYSSNYTRAIATAKYLAEKNNLDINIVDGFGERKFGFELGYKKIDNFEEKQYEDENFKFGNGESQKEVRERMQSTLMKVIRENQGKRIAILTHSTATLFLLKGYVDIDNDGNCKFKNHIFFNKDNWEYCQTFKLIFDDEELIDISIID